MRSETPPVLVFSHLRWDFVYQRPQQVLSRFAADRRVVFVEEPLRDDDGGGPRWERAECAPGVTCCRPRLAAAEGGFSDAQLPTLHRMLPELLATQGLERPVVWFYTPMAVPLLPALNPAAVVYDCMDELAAFAGAPPELLARERALLEVADVVFAGGPSLYRAKRERHANVLCLPSSVDVAHFGRAAVGVDEPDDQRALPRPRLGFFGVIDERLDRDLLGAVAALRPAWQIVMVGPVVKIDPATLPRRPNLHYLGGRPYAVLPDYVAGWDVCLLPFAHNAATRFISPTKTLEYMAAERPIVSTSVRDVAEPYGDVVLLGDDPASFVAACEAALAAPSAARRDAMRRIVAATSWGGTVHTMRTAIDDVVRRRRTGHREETSSWHRTTSPSSAPGRQA
jgi:UDP-galactopyranose mutase